MTFSSCLTNEDVSIVLDSSVVINLLATGQAASIIRALAIPIVITENVVREIELGGANGRAEPSLLKKLIGERVVSVRDLEGEALTIFLDLVSGSASESLGDGEAASLAFAYQYSCRAGIDEKKATRVAADRFRQMKLVTTVDILAHESVRESLGGASLIEATFRALRIARMQVRQDQFDWVARLIGSENLATCPSLRRLMRSRSLIEAP